MLQERQPEPAARAVEDTVRQDKSTGGLRRIYNALRYSLQGIGAAVKQESAFRQEMILCAVLVPVAALLPVGLLGKALMLGSLFLVLITELLNSAIEWTVDYVSQETHPFARRAKDMGSAAVFFSLVNVLVVWVLVIAQAWQDGMFG
ncbi:diacylglycerol kinase [Ruficoccus amylovorans]|uniref:Diacylglycerol kinase n=1 Tax=Ruficoccus amylovorans TaxID=1804625 RepID=A0A842H9H5_9BACT|nr:diacylglycerol kinase [Ruficoccus amylovorans]MBC2593163.1 diacylglycerol kinase [Ruficoccus amylovorans]